jgi:uncharacterized membrane protein YgcG
MLKTLMTESDPIIINKLQHQITNMRKNIPLAAIAFFVFATTVSAQEDISEAKWQSTPIVIDGHDAEWNPPFNLFDNKSGLIFTITNDKQNLYLCFTENEELKAEKIMKAGWTIELSSSEKKRKFDAQISFPKIEDPNINLKADFKNQVSYYKMDLAVIKTKGFLYNNGDVPLTNKDGVNIAIGSENDQKIIYEIAIPIKELMEQDKLQLNEVITLDVTVNGLDNKPAGQSTAPSGGGRNGFGGGGGGRGGGGRMGGGGGRRGGMSQTDNSANDRTSIFDKVSFKQKFRLTSK